MKSKLLAIALSFLPALGANAQDLGRREISALTHRIEAGRNRIYKKIHGKNGTRVLHYYISPDHPVQGDSVTLFAEVQTDFTGEELLLQGSFDGAAATLEQPTTDLFVANLGVFNQISSHKFQGQIFIQSHSDAEQLRNAISQLNTQISSLNAQIAATTDPTLLAQLQAQLAQAQAEQAQLTQSLINLKSPVDEEDFSFEVQANTSSQNFPHISGISPSVGFLNSAAQITISGTNFSANPVVTLGGQSVTVSSSSATSIVGHVSGFSTTGPKDLEVDFSNAGQATNAVLKGGFFVTDTALGNSAPVAVASASAAQINLGSAANFVSTGSNDPQNGGLVFQWQLISVPSGSHVPVPSAGTSASYSITPDVPGAYVASLVVSSSLSNLASAPSLAVVQVAAPANQAPVLTGGSISLNTQATATLQLGLSDESWQAHSYLITRAPGHGSATVSSTGLVSYSAGSTTTTDSFDVMVLDNGTPPLSASVTIPVSILASHPPVASAPPITVAPGVAGASQVNAYAFDSGKTVTIALSNQPANGTATISSSGLVTYAPNSGFSGADSIGVVVTDSGTPPLSTSISIPVMVSSLTPPSIPNFLAYRIFVANSPFQVGMAVNSAQPQQIVAGNGGVASVVWDFGDGSHEKIADFLYAGMTHYYVNPGSFTATLTVTDRAGLTASLSQQVVVASIPVPIVRVSMNPSTGGAAPLSVTLDASASTVSSGAISEYHWQFCGVNPETVTTAPTITHSFATTCTVRVRAFGPTGLLGQGGGVAAGSANIVVPVGNAVSGAAPSSQVNVLPPIETAVGTPVSMDASRAFDTNVGGSLTAYNWNFNDFACTSNCTPSGFSTNHVYTAPFNFSPSVTVTNAFGLTNTAVQPVFYVNLVGTQHQPHAVHVVSATKGVAPFTVNFDLSQSYSYNGFPLQSYIFEFPDGSPNGTTSTTTHTFASPGVYLVKGSVIDSDGNRNYAGQTITVTATREEEAESTPGILDADRELQRQTLSLACGQNDGASCYSLSQMYAEDGDFYTAGLLKQKSCGLGFQPACSKED